MINRFEALSLENIIPAGRNRPLVVSCENSATHDQIRSRIVVKALGLPEITKQGMYCELLGNILARELGIWTPKPCVVNLDDQFVSIVNETKKLKLRAGLAVGTEYFTGAPFLPGQHLDAEQIMQAARIYAFDLLVQNPDRVKSNPNCAVQGERLIAYDFELAFSFLLAIGSKPAPWRFSNLSIRTNHVFRVALSQAEVYWEPFVKSVQTLNLKKLKKLCAFVPAEFGDYSEEICKHLMSVLKNADKLVVELGRSLI